VAYAPPVTPAQPSYTEPAPRRKKRSVNWLSAVTILLVLVLTVSFAIFAFSASAQNATMRKQIVALQQQIKDLQTEIKKNSYTGNGNSVSGTPSSPDGLTPGQVYAQNIDSVVLVNATTPAGISTGSGFVLTEDGYVVTNYHVVEGGTAFHVTTSDGTKYLAVLTGGDETNDVAVLKVNGANLDPVELGSSDDLIVGDQVVAIGNPLGELTSTLTVGYISAKDRDVTTDGTSINMLQTDASINSGNSGGPLFNMKGQVIGITTAKYSGNTSSGASIEGIGFAIPIDDVKGMLQEIMDNGYVSRPYLGVYIRDTAEGIGVYVESLEPLGPAYLAGMRSGDIIVQLGDSPVTSINSLSKALYAYKAGDTATVIVYRNRQILELKITFAEKPQAEN
jgi:serine protease Do